MEEEQTDEVIARMRALDQRMDELGEREELYWKQPTEPTKLVLISPTFKHQRVQVLEFERMV